MTTAVTVSPTPILQFFDNRGLPAIGGSVLTQVGGINAATYQDAAGTIPLPNPIPLNNRGEVSNASGISCQLFLAQGVVYTFTLLDANGNVLNQSTSVGTPAPPSAATGTFSQASTYAIGTLGFKLQRDGISVTDAPFNADYTGATDSTAAINAAITQAVAAGQKFVNVPPGTYLISGTLNDTAGIALIGSGRNCTTITWSSTTLQAYAIATNNQAIVRDILWAAPLNCTAGGCISLTGSGGGDNAFSQITGCEFSNGFTQISTTNAFAFQWTRNYLSGAVSAAMIVQNVVVPDAGDSEIDTFTISNLGASAIGILQTSSGGLRINNGKILGGTQAIALNLLAGDATSILKVSNISAELQTSAAITLLVGAGASFALVTIEDYSLSQVPIGINIPGDGGTVRLTNLTIGSGVISLTAAGTQGIIVNDVANFTIAPTSIIGNGGTPTGIVVGGFSVQGRIYPGSIQGCATKISNGSGTTVVVSEDIQAGTAAVTCSTARGALFSGTAAVTFAIAFDSPPTVTCDPGSVGNGISAWPTAVTKTGFTLNAVSATTGGAGNANYIATGVL